MQIRAKTDIEEQKYWIYEPREGSWNFGNIIRHRLGVWEYFKLSCGEEVVANSGRKFLHPNWKQLRLEALFLYKTPPTHNEGC